MRRCNDYNNKILSHYHTGVIDMLLVHVVQLCSRNWLGQFFGLSILDTLEDNVLLIRPGGGYNLYSKGQVQYYARKDVVLVKYNAS